MVAIFVQGTATFQFGVNSQRHFLNTLISGDLDAVVVVMVMMMMVVVMELVLTVLGKMIAAAVV